MNQLLAYIDSLNPFLQGLVGSAAFAAATIALRLLLRSARKGGKSISRVLSHQYVMRHILYRDFVHSTRMPEFTWGYFVVLAHALRSTVQAFAVLVFIAGVWAVVSGAWIAVLGCYIAFNLLLDAVLWLKDWSSEKEINIYDEQVKKELLAKFPSKATPSEVK